MIHEEKLRLPHKGRPPFRRPFGTPAPQSKRRLQELSTSGQRFRTVFPPGSAVPFEPLPGLTEKGDSAFMQLHSCQLKSGLSAHMTDSSFLAKCLFLSTGLPLPSRKQNSQPPARVVLAVGAKDTVCPRPDRRSAKGTACLDMERPFFQYKWE